MTDIAAASASTENRRPFLKTQSGGTDRLSLNYRNQEAVSPKLRLPLGAEGVQGQLAEFPNIASQASTAASSIVNKYDRNRLAIVGVIGSISIIATVAFMITAIISEDYFFSAAAAVAAGIGFVALAYGHKITRI